MLAAYKGHTEVVELLLARLEIDVNAQTWQGDTALDCALQSKHLAITNLLKEKGGKKRTALALKGTARDALYCFGSSLAIFGCMHIVVYCKNLPLSREPWQNVVLLYGFFSTVVSVVLLLLYSNNIDQLISPTYLTNIQKYEYYVQNITNIDLILY